jgi:hypothetical protein
MKIIRTVIAAALMGSTAIVPAAAQDRISLVAGFLPDPEVRQVSAGGSLELTSNHGTDCTGFVSEAPTVRLSYDADDEEKLFISVRSDTDTVLMVRAPNGAVSCSDDSFENNLNPGVSFDDPQSGQYQIWVGTYDEQDLAQAELQISEIGFGTSESEELGAAHGDDEGAESEEGDEPVT